MTDDAAAASQVTVCIPMGSHADSAEFMPDPPPAPSENFPSPTPPPTWHGRIWASALAMPLIAVAWSQLFTLVASGRPPLRLALLRFRVWDLLVLFLAVWAGGFLIRLILTTKQGVQVDESLARSARPFRLVYSLVAPVLLAAGTYLLLHRSGAAIAQGWLIIAFGACVYFAIFLMRLQLRSGAAFSSVLSGLLAVAAWFSLADPDAPLFATICRYALVLLLFLAAMAPRAPDGGGETMLGTSLAVSGAYLIAVAAGLSPMIWSGDLGLAFQGPFTLLLTLALAFNRLVLLISRGYAHDATASEKAETVQLEKVWLLLAAAGVFAAGLCWIRSNENGKPFAVAVFVSVLASAILATRRKTLPLPRLRFWADVIMLSPLLMLGSLD